MALGHAPGDVLVEVHVTVGHAHVPDEGSSGPRVVLGPAALALAVAATVGGEIDGSSRRPRCA